MTVLAGTSWTGLPFMWVRWGAADVETRGLGDGEKSSVCMAVLVEGWEFWDGVAVGIEAKIRVAEIAEGLDEVLHWLAVGFELELAVVDDEEGAGLAGSEGVSAFGVFRGRPPFAPFAFAAALFALERWLPMREPTLILCPQWGHFMG